MPYNNCELAICKFRNGGGGGKMVGGEVSSIHTKYSTKCSTSMSYTLDSSNKQAPVSYEEIWIQQYIYDRPLWKNFP